MQCLLAGNVDLECEWALCWRIGENNSKNYQLWNHRRRCAMLLGRANADNELEFAEHFLKQDAKNYHIWAHRQVCAGIGIVSVIAVLTLMFNLPGSSSEIMSSCAESYRLGVVLGKVWQPLDINRTYLENAQSCGEHVQHLGSEALIRSKLPRNTGVRYCKLWQGAQNRPTLAMLCSSLASFCQHRSVAKASEILQSTDRL
jgi:hypothetical protein